MTVIKCRREIGDGLIAEGFQISCHNSECHASNFFPSKKHLPDVVVAKKFRDRGWDVSSSGKDTCPTCLEKRRGRRSKDAPPVPAPVIPFKQIRTISSENILRILREVAGLAPMDVQELECNGHRKFKIPFAGTEFQMGKMRKAESEIVQQCAASIHDSYMKAGFTNEFSNGKFTITPHLAWYISLSQRDLIAAAR